MFSVSHVAYIFRVPLCIKLSNFEETSSFGWNHHLMPLTVAVKKVFFLLGASAPRPPTLHPGVNISPISSILYGPYDPYNTHIPDMIWTVQFICSPHTREYGPYGPYVAQYGIIYGSNGPYLAQHTRKYGSYGPYMAQHSRKLSKIGKSKIPSKYQSFSNVHIYDLHASRQKNGYIQNPIKKQSY